MPEDQIFRVDRELGKTWGIGMVNDGFKETKFNGLQHCQIIHILFLQELVTLMTQRSRGYAGRVWLRSSGIQCQCWNSWAGSTGLVSL